MDKTRRRLLVTGVAALGGRALPRSLAVPLAMAAAPAGALGPNDRIQFAPAPFTLGVASGDPTPSAVVIWTRLAPQPLAPHGGLTAPENVTWAVATDEQFNNTIAMGSVTADPADAGAVHVDVTGLAPGSDYYYAFWDAGGTPSPVGRMRTAPLGATSQARFAVVSCQAIGAGRYAAFDRLTEENLDFILHVGDYIYEGGMGGGWPPEVQVDANDLDSYRARYALYRGDPQLRAAHHAVPWVLSWDDHEVVNEYWANPNDAAFLARRAAAYQAWYEHMPMRPPAGLPDPATGFRIYRQLAFGDLIDLMVLDTRQYRDRHPCNTAVNPTGCPDSDLDNPDRTMLGADQKQWLKGALSASTATWRGVASPLLMADLRVGGLATYTVPWQGTEAERTEILRHVVNNNIDNFVVLSGDWHRSIVANLKANFVDDSTPDMGSEFSVTSVTSNNDGDFGGAFSAAMQQVLYPQNLHLRYYESELHGYIVCDVTKSHWLATYRSVDRTDPSAPAETQAVFQVDSGVPGVRMISGLGGSPYPANFSGIL